MVAREERGEERQRKREGGGVKGEVEREGKEKREEVGMERGKGKGEKGRREGERENRPLFTDSLLSFFNSNLDPALAIVNSHVHIKSRSSCCVKPLWKHPHRCTFLSRVSNMILKRHISIEINKIKVSSRRTRDWVCVFSMQIIMY